MAHAHLDLLSFSNPVFSSYAYWGAILVIKCFLMSPWTSYFRYKNKAPISPEDVSIHKFVGARGEIKVNHSHPEVERVRRGHLNDLENILPYLFVGLFYVLTNPSVSLAKTLFKVAALARIVHTIVYTVIVIPQPARGTAWAIHYAIALYMAISVVLYSK
ncbi:microsomal glutathione S-transferase 1-like [Sitodiplosis mosellana]|uniref:microsomal glutathione S-transferase 1-like n=1 Tax=Sitodiplosis mosellana TaxID=263140 RepID=UPI002444AD7E|nr:microsomal glutathione S-transferase 1-like [Sitodiplosis mosellana]